MESLESELITLVDRKQWREILKLGSVYPLKEFSKFLWAWPSEKCLTDLQSTIKHHKIGNILSIGCGSGLLEWIIQESLDIPVYGLELDNSWWSSAYAPTTFIQLNFTTSRPITTEFLNNCCQLNHHSTDFALLFCYFNNRNAFNEYVCRYEGQFIIIIGPIEGCNVVTDPLPLSPQFERAADWILIETITIEHSNNVIALYKRCVKNK